MSNPQLPNVDNEQTLEQEDIEPFQNLQTGSQAEDGTKQKLIAFLRTLYVSAPVIVT
ncbi:hypothetical protein ACQ4M3_39700 [Leptolyngbya sp. AN03gr2]|uniref:hypothetical protein n=1 Tax=unclassified Leptolyngbya TaxID=2650499 RepID=UPI003D322B1E